ncbi:MAG TPA: VWA domain-containing protein [Bryobacteraceae bacterium]|jgi:VWFA-related protein|nr:VWA domain-containing protein [Bryobacteraceae bacterium]
MFSGFHCKRRLVLILLAGAPFPAQDPPSIKVEVDLVNVLCSVRDQRGALVSHLKQEDFILLEEGKPQVIRHFARETNLPLTVGLLVDTSNSQVHLIEGERRAAAQFLSQVIRPRDSAFLLSFDARTELLMDRTSSPNAIRRGLEKLQEVSPQLHRRGGTGRPRGTVLYDAVEEASRMRLGGEPGRKALVLITDGMDVGSRLRMDEAIDAAQKADTMIYSIYYVDSKAYGGAEWANRLGQSVLLEMSQQTGGRFFRVDRKHPLKQIFDQIQQEMRSQYSLQFISSDHRKDGLYRRLDVYLRDPNLKAQARKGYYAPKTDGVE